MIVIYTQEVTNRLVYTIDTVFREYFGLPSLLVTNPDDAPADGCRINYSDTPLSGWFSIHREPLLFERGIKPQQPFISRISDIPVIFEGPDSKELHFDIFAAVFYLLSRYEEYLPHEQDEHGRYRSVNSVLSRPTLEFSPIVESWLLLLRSKLQERYPELRFKTHVKEVECTFDIDQAFAYKERRWPKILGSLVKQAGRKVLITGDNDPYDTLPEIHRFLTEYNLPARFFFLLNDRGPYNSSVNPRSALLRTRIRQCADRFLIGIHPSYSAPEDGLLEPEKWLLQEQAGCRVEHSRQHFLRISFPAYFRQLIAAGITHDHSLGYADVSGFRAGFSRPFRFYDLEQDRQTDLWLHPFAFMDATYIYYKRSQTNQIIQKILKLSDQVSKVNGKLVTVSHNDLLDDHCPVNFWEVLKNCAV